MFFLVTILPIIAIVLIEVVMVLLYSIDGFTTGEIIYVVCLPLVYLLLAYGIPKLLSRIINIDKLVSSEISQNPEVKMIFNNDGIKADLVNTNYDLKWSYFTKIIEREQFFYFYYPELKQLDVPKRAFSDVQIEKLYQIITNNVDPKQTKIKLKKIKKGEK